MLVTLVCTYRSMCGKWLEITKTKLKLVYEKIIFVSSSNPFSGGVGKKLLY